ncbi:hypothetical protein ABID82_001048 [Methylobacterium sp. PvP062]|uniref:Uncharacterized protein n=1 Tax=Methylobacterium radiotolerans TaxID=31998 RepID=A0ABV2NFZ6_9HYPH|nr:MULTISPECIES: hypothetical protein [unclassified Methylobacterium]MBP2497845.1 hypothetical protein [Methylobacterium sp. PvP105]MBP2502284.1 hypothetical protein [Methylobacterium sp. PvP109]MCX7334860.1 hypothetical protein [Hyphomicrobiales bacterium]
MSFIVVQGQEDHEQADAVLRGVADGLARLFRVPDHPPGVQDLLDAGTRDEDDRPGQVVQRGARRGGSQGPPGARSVKTGTRGTRRGAARPSSRARGRRAMAEAQSGQRDPS